MAACGYYNRPHAIFKEILSLKMDFYDREDLGVGME